MTAAARAKTRPKHTLEARLRRGRLGDVAALLAFERRTFTVDRISARSFGRFLKSPQAAVIVADDGEGVAGYALVLFRAGSAAARLYSIGVSSQKSGFGLGTRLLKAAEREALARGVNILRLEVQETNAAAIALYRKAGYRQFARREGYYEDGSPALRYQKPLAKRP